MCLLLCLVVTLAVLGSLLGRTVAADPKPAQGKPSDAPDQQPRLLLDKKQQAELAEARQRLETAGALYRQGKLSEALPLAREAVQIHERIFGPHAIECVGGLNDLAALHQSLADYAQAETLYRKVLEIRRKVQGVRHPDYAAALGSLGSLYHLLGDYARAEPLLRESLEVFRSTLGPKHLDCVAALNNLATLYHVAGEYGRAEPLLREALELSKQLVGESSPHYARSLNNLAGLYCSMGDYARAEPLLRQTAEISKVVDGPTSPAYATCLNNLAGLYYSAEDYDRAEPLFRQSLALRESALGRKHPDYAAGLDNLAGVYEAQGRYEKARPLYQQALEIRKEALGTNHPEFALGLNNLAGLHKAMKEYDRAEPLYREAMEISRVSLGPRHPRYAVALNNLASLYRAKGDYRRAEPLYEQALDITQQVFQETATVLSERQQLAMIRSVRRTLDGYLSASADSRGSDAAVYRHVLAWKGSVFVRQQRARQSADRPEMAQMLTQLQGVSSRLATLMLAVPDPQQKGLWERQLIELGEKKERLEADLSRLGVQPDAKRAVSPDILRAALPPDVVLVDFLEYARSGPAAGEVNCLVAFVMGRDRPVTRLELGPVEPVSQAIDRWRENFGRTSKEIEASAALRRAIWQPLKEHLGDAPIVLVSPDGALARFPLATLPGMKPDSYLIEERAIAIVPVPQMLPELLREKTGTSTSRDGAASAGKAVPRLLLVGDVDYDAMPDVSAGATTSRWAVRHNEAFRFSRLDNTRGEILAVRDSFEAAYPEGKVRVLRQRGATEEAFRREVQQCGWLHLATHGFFSPPDVRSLTAPEGGTRTGRSWAPDPVSGWAGRAAHPGLLSGFALAGANVPAGPGGYDGLLTAVEIASIDLGPMELAVLSACETGLGPVAGGEGVLGLQRAFQVAGARSVVASLWKVDDDATRELMERFYENLWRRKLGKLQSLRQAQLSILRVESSRGVRLVPADSASARPQRRPPQYWAAFELSGDWR